MEFKKIVAIIRNAELEKVEGRLVDMRGRGNQS